jgi:hypothetical protein
MAVVAGQAAGGIRVGGDVNDAMGILGPVLNRSERDKYAVYDWPFNPFLVVAEKENGKVVLVLIQLSDLYKTDKGSLTGGSERALVETTYGKEFTTDENQRTQTMVYDAQGIAFDIGKSGVLSGKVMSIIVFVPNQWKAITASL